MGERRWFELGPKGASHLMSYREVLAEMGGKRITRCSRHHWFWDDPDDAGCVVALRTGDFQCDQAEVVWIVPEAARKPGLREVAERSGIDTDRIVEQDDQIDLISGKVTRGASDG
jgi:hypothetical protein